MNSGILVLMIMAILPLVCGIIGSYYKHKQFGAVDNKHPRAQSALLEGAGARMVGAQSNAWEALIIYASALLALNVAQVPLTEYATLVWVFLACRVFHAVAYWANKDIIRSLVFMGGYGICIYLFVLAL